MITLWLLLVPYTTIAYGIHGGEGITGVNRQLRNLLCALPFLIVYSVLFSHLSPSWHWSLALSGGALAYLGTNMGFDHHPLWLKGLITFPPLGMILLPLAYSTETIAERQEYLSGFFYGVALTIMALCYVSFQ